VIVYFYRGLSEWEQKEVHMLDLHREKTLSVTQGEKTWEDNPAKEGPPGRDLGAAAHRAGATAQGSQPMNFNLVDPTSTAFEE
jgi:hypothetical protein